MTVKLPTPDRPLKIGTRGSPLALAQAHETRFRLMAAFDLTEQSFEIKVIKVTGDSIQDRPLKDLGGKGLFTREIEDALLEGVVDIAVHSMKDMPVDQPDGLVLDCYLPREDCRDALVSLDGRSFEDLAQGAVVGTSSIRRKAQILHRRPDIKVVEFRGNVQTRLSKLRDGIAEATFLAMAGLNRLNLHKVKRFPVSPDALLPAIAQGAIGVERRVNDTGISEILDAIHHLPTGQTLLAERSFLKALDGSCQTPIAGLAVVEGAEIKLSGEVLRVDGTEVVANEFSGPIETGEAIGKQLAKGLLERAGSGFFDWH